uniref:Ig-like domain-containing protein n=1 Tax=Oryzias latipes TaxID=8090 RepID=A0A3B3IEL0_ORYLA
MMTVMEVRDGNEVSLTCSGGGNFHDGCKSMTWIYDDSTNTVTLFEHGKIHKDAGSKSERLNLSEDCSLVLKKITAEVEGRYSCRLSRPFRSQLTDVVVRLTIIDVMKTCRFLCTNEDMNTFLSCKSSCFSPFTSRFCLFEVNSGLGICCMQKKEFPHCGINKVLSIYLICLLF